MGMFCGKSGYCYVADRWGDNPVGGTPANPLENIGTPPTPVVTTQPVTVPSIPVNVPTTPVTSTPVTVPSTPTTGRSTGPTVVKTVTLFLLCISYPSLVHPSFMLLVRGHVLPSQPLFLSPSICRRGHREDTPCHMSYAGVLAVLRASRNSIGSLVPLGAGLLYEGQSVDRILSWQCIGLMVSTPHVRQQNMLIEQSVHLAIRLTGGLPL